MEIELIGIVHKKRTEIAKYANDFHYNTLKRYIKRLFRKIGSPAIIITQLSMFE